MIVNETLTKFSFGWDTERVEYISDGTTACEDTQSVKKTASRPVTHQPDHWLSWKFPKNVDALNFYGEKTTIQTQPG